MANFNIKSFFSKNWIHFLALGLFFIITFIYFKPQFEGNRLKQHDIEQFKGMSNEIVHFRETTGEEPLWTNSMFGGMPAYQISTIYEGNLLTKAIRIFRLGLSSPAGMFIVYLIGFYILLLCFRVNPKVAIFGAIAFAFSSYFIIILQAGHNSKASAIGLMAPVIGAFYMAYRYNLKWGIILSCLFMGMQLAANHFQITYYLGFILFGMGVVELIRRFTSSDWKRFIYATLGVLVAYAFALGINYGNITLTNDYAKHTIRGGNDISINPKGVSNSVIKTSGLDKDYITQWSYGIGESMTLLSPYIKGGASASVANSQFSEKLRSSEFRRDANLIAQNNVYWGDQPFVSGPVYLGIVIFFLALLGLIYLNGRLKWALFAVTILALMLSWGKNFMGLTDFLLEYLPGYNKFRAVTIVLAVVELTVPLLGVLFLDKLFKDREKIKQNIRPLFIASGGLVLLLGVLSFTGLGDNFLSKEEQKIVNNPESYIDQQKDQLLYRLKQQDPRVLKQNGIDINNRDQISQFINSRVPSVQDVNKQFDTLIDFRSSIYRGSMWRSILFLILGAGLIFLYLYVNLRKEYILLGLGALVLIDLVGVDLNYLNNEKNKNNRNYQYWVDKEEYDFPIAPNQADRQIMEMETENDPDLKNKISQAVNEREVRRSRNSMNYLASKRFQTLSMNTNFRVYEFSGDFNSSRSSYFHKSLNGYHGAKLRRIQNLKDFHINRNNMDVFNMLNVKYFIYGSKQDQRWRAQLNNQALGGAWLVKELDVQRNPDMELLALGDLYQIDLVDQSYDLIINSLKKKTDTVSGYESISLIAEGDTLFKGITNVTRSNVSSVYVEDVNGAKNWIPKTEFLKDTLNSFSIILELNRVHDFEPSSEAIVSEEVASNVSSLTYSGEGTVDFVDYKPNRLEYNVRCESPQFMVFSEIYYPKGWTAYVGGKEVDIHRVNYLLRGIELPAGEHNVIMKFDVPKFKMANIMGYIGSIILFIVILLFFVKDFILKTN